MRIRRRGRRPLAKRGRCQVNASRQFIQRHGSRSSLSGQFLCHRIAGFAGVDDGQRASSVGGKGQHPLGIVPSRIWTFADCKIRQRLAGIRIHHRHLPPVANGKEPPSCGINGQAGGRIAVGYRPACGDGLGCRVETVNLILGFDIREHRARTIRNRELGFARERDGRNHLALSSVNYSYITTPAIESPHGFCLWLKHNSIWIRARRN